MLIFVIKSINRGNFFQTITDKDSITQESFQVDKQGFCSIGTDDINIIKI